MSKKTIRAIKIDSTERTVTEVQIPNTLAALQEAVGGYIERGLEIDGNDLYVNEEGLLDSECDEFFFYEGAHQPFAGSAILVGVDAEGDTISTTLDLETVKKSVRFYSRMDIALAMKLGIQL
jgi:hypothetical protein